jgi:hypothetical protein
MKKLIKKLKHLFIPHIHNDYKPHFFREVSVTTILVIAIILLGASVGSKLYIRNTNMTAEVLPSVLVDLTNMDRASNGEPSLTRNPTLDAAAKLKADDMASLQYFAHTSPQGITPWHWFNKVGYYFTYAGENLAIDFTESTDVERAWLASPKHRENIMSNNFTEIGIATVDGFYNGAPTTYVVQMFGTPAFIQKAEASTPTTVAPVATPKPVTPKPSVKPTPKPATPVTEVAVAPVVKGETAGVLEQVQTVIDKTPVVAEENLVTITENKDFIFVKNNASNDEVALQTPTTIDASPKYSTWSQRLIFLLPSYTNTLYRIFFWLVIVALLLMTIIEIRRQHPKNITYGILLVVIIFTFIYINKAMFINTLLV